jgi:excisionase family DNA binding protein
VRAPGHHPHPALLLTPEQAAHELQIGRHKVFDLITSGELHSIKIGKSRRIPRAAIEEFISELAAAQDSGPAAAAG